MNLIKFTMEKLYKEGLLSKKEFDLSLRIMEKNGEKRGD